VQAWESRSGGIAEGREALSTADREVGATAFGAQEADATVFGAQEAGGTAFGGQEAGATDSLTRFVRNAG
jgi:hypothetical protein